MAKDRDVQSKLGYESVTPRQHDANNPYTQISNEFIEDRTLHDGDAHWLIDWALSKPRGWKFEHRQMEKWFRWGQHKLDRILTLAKQRSYLITVRLRNSDGTLGKDLFYFFEYPRECADAARAFANSGFLKPTATGTFIEKPKSASGANIDGAGTSKGSRARSADSTRVRTSSGFPHVDNSFYSINTDSDQI